MLRAAVAHFVLRSISDLKAHAIIVAVVLVAGSLASTRAQTSSTLRVRAFIDGRSQLVITPNSIHWEHFDYTRPGRWFTNAPTYLGDFVWYPRWPDSNDQQAGPSWPISVTGVFTTNQLTMQVVSARGSVNIVQQPNTSNEDTCIVEFNDDFPYEADWYEIILSGISLAIVRPQALDIRVSQVELCWETASNKWYQVLYRSTLTTNLWAPLTGAWLAGDGARSCITDEVLVSYPRRFYQLSVTNSPP